MSAKDKYIEDRQYLIDKSSNPDKKKDSLGIEFDRRVEQGKIIVKNGNYQLNPSKEVKEFVDAGKAKFKSELAKGGEVKKYKKGGSVHKNKSKMITKRGWGASRKT